MLYVKCLCVLSRYLSPIVDIWIILSGMFVYKKEKDVSDVIVVKV